MKSSVRLMAGFCAALLMAASALAQPPSIEIPAEVRPSGQYVTFQPKTDAVSVTYVGLDGIDPVPNSLLSSPTAFLLDVFGKPAKKYRFVAVAAGKDGKQTRVDFVVPIGTPTTDPGQPGLPVPGQPPTQPPPTTPAPTAKYYFMFVRPTGPVAPALQDAFELTGWNDLEKAGHVWKHYPLDKVDPVYANKIPVGTRIPAILKLKYSDDRKTVTMVGDPIAVPEKPTNDFVAGLWKN